MGIGGEMMRAAVFLDRDGVINRSVIRERKPCAPRALAELELLPGVPEALRGTQGRRLPPRGRVTNQPDVARGTTPRRSSTP